MPILMWKIGSKKQIMTKKRKKEQKFLGYIKNPFACNDREKVYKIMVHQTPKNGVFCYYFTSLEAENSSYDSHHDCDLEEVLFDWQNEIDERGWQEIL